MMNQMLKAVKCLVMGHLLQDNTFCKCRCCGKVFVRLSDGSLVRMNGGDVHLPEAMK